MILAVAWEKQQELVGQEATWYEQRWDRRTVLENDKAKLVWDFDFHLRKTTTARRSGLILKLKTGKKIWMLAKYRQLAFKTRERRPSYKICVVPVVVGALGGGTKALKVNLKKIFDNNELLDEVVSMMQKTVLMDSESIVRRVMSGLIQGENNE